MDGPYDLNSIISRGGCPNEWAEIAHAVTLAPPNAGKVLIWNRRFILPGSGDEACGKQLTWLWDWTLPMQLTEVEVPTETDPIAGTQDTFCGTHTLRNGQQGKVISMGGTDMYEWSQNAWAVGTRNVFEFNNDDANPAWTELASLNHLRYYNSSMRKSTGEIVTYGNSGVLPGTGAPSTADESRELALNPAVLWDDLVNARLGSGTPCYTIQDVYAMATPNYADVHLLSTGNWLRVDTPITLPPTPTAFLLDNICSLPVLNNKGRIEESTAGGPVPSPFGSSAHLLYLTGINNDTREEVVYAIGGSDEYLDCEAPTNYSNKVLKMTNPEPYGTQWDDSPPDLDDPRATHNVIILLDGSQLVVGGADFVDSSCKAVTDVDLYKTPEIFEATPSGWLAMAPLTHARTYHSVAVLLPDGSVMIAGGVGDGNNPGSSYQAPWHSIERYKPPYMFFTRPVITSVLGPSPLPYGTGELELAVNLLEEAADEFRVALLSPCSGTHNVDYNQRYVELEWDDFVPDMQGGATLTVKAPESAFVAPPGMYMLTVVNKIGIPSVAKWVWIGS